MIIDHPAHIIVGETESSMHEAASLLARQFCPNQGCGVCTVCNQIREHQYYGCTWLTTEKNYTLDDLDIIFTTCAYSLQHNEHHFIVICKAELLSPACGNSLLKIIEEPPTGYHFLLLTNNLNALLPTIRSRCIITMLPSSHYTDPNYNSLLDCFKHPGSVKPDQFLKLLETASFSEQESIKVVDDLIRYWSAKAKEALTAGDQATLSSSLQMVTDLQNMLAKPPMPGSFKIFWRTLYLMVHAMHTNTK